MSSISVKLLVMSLNIAELENMIEEVENMNQFEQNHIYKILTNNGVKLSENSNGFFVSLNQLTQETIDDILNYLKQSNEMKNSSQNAIQFTERRIERTDLVEDCKIMQTNDGSKSIELDVENWKRTIVDNLKKTTKKKK